MEIKSIICMAVAISLALIVDALLQYIACSLKASRTAKICLKLRIPVNYSDSQIQMTGYIRSVSLLSIELECKNGIIVSIPSINGANITRCDRGDISKAV